MTAELRFFWARLNANYWFYPALFSVGAAVLALTLVALDRSGTFSWLNEAEWLIPARPKGAADMLTVMAGSMIGVASTVFSITIAAVAYASGNYGPRLLTNFMEDRGNQISLATFIGSFVYALVVLRSVRTEDETAVVADQANLLPGFVPQFSLLVAYLLMALCVAVLVFFLNHIPSSIRINKVLELIGKRLIKVVQETYPSEDEFRELPQPRGGKSLRAWDTGYIQMIDYGDLARVAAKHECVISLRVRTGDFIHREVPLMDVLGDAPDDLVEDVRSHFTLGPTRTPEQDPQFLIDELVEIGVRALSPGINDPFTAITALHWLGAATAEIGRRDLVRDVCAEVELDGGECPLIPLPSDFDHFVARGFGSMRGAVAASPTAAKVMFDVMVDAATPLANASRRASLRDQGEMLMQQAREVLAGPDLKNLEKDYAEFCSRFD